jgi:DNA-binding response OmpR family regulator
MELKNLAEERNRDLMILVIQDIMPKFKTLTSAQKNKIETRIQFLSAVTKEIQKVSGALSTLKDVAQK